MDTLLLIALAILIVFFSFIIIRSWLLQRQFKKSLNLNSTKNNSILLKQASGLSVSLIVFALVLTNSSSFLPKENDAMLSNNTEENVREAIDQYSEKSQGFMDNFESDDIRIIGEVTLEEHQMFVLVEIDGVYYLVDESDNSIIEVKQAP